MRRWRIPRLLLTTALLGSGVLVNGGLALVHSGTRSALWSTQTTPNTVARHGELDGISCLAGRWCMAVGDYVAENGQHVPLTEVRGRSRWSIEKTPSIDGATLTSVSCVSKTFCEAVASVGSEAVRSAGFAETWNGTAWRVQANPPGNLSGADLVGVSCTAKTFCEAVGVTGVTGSVAEKWNGKTWSLQAANVQYLGNLLSVSCASSSFCEAVGTDLGGTQGGSLTDMFNGSRWTIQSGPAGQPPYGLLSSVSCPSRTFCEAAGYGPWGGGVTLVEVWNGVTWRQQSLPDSAGASLPSVACGSKDFCEASALTYSPSTGREVQLLEKWSGRVWKVQRPPDVGTANANPFAMSCPTSKFCEAVGSITAALSDEGEDAVPGLVYNGLTDPRPLTEAWTGGGWRIQVGVGRVGATYNLLSAVSCPTRVSCQAVGWSGSGNTLAERWNGKAHGFGMHMLSQYLREHVSRAVERQGVVARSDPTFPEPTQSRAIRDFMPLSSFCEAVGDNGNERNLAETWNGRTWAAQAAPNPPSHYGRLVAVSCFSADFCEAAGYSIQPGQGPLQPQAEVWNGKVWSAQSPPGLSRGDQLLGVSCVSPSFCMAVGAANGGGAGSSSLIEKWNGSRWTIQKGSPHPQAPDELNGVACTSTRFCAAVGCSAEEDCSQGPSGHNGMLAVAETWNGSRWRERQLANVADGTLASVSCLSARFCESAGYLDDHSLVEKWNGTHWAESEGATSPSYTAYLTGISCVHSGTCEAIGTNGMATLAEEYRG